ncbi:MAG: PilZ domain-containing protein [Treponema sp.]|jgi:hypothetical protein|nr:PilZ domain-containing protein [Treponema sp.]
MKLMVILDSDEVLTIISGKIRPLGFDIVRYRHVLKAMDNLEEIDPAGIIISAQDFPRHWKTLVQFVRSERPKEICPIVVLAGAGFSIDDAAKAFYIGINGIVPENLGHAAEVDRLQSILGRYIELDERRRARRHHMDKWMRFGLCIINPRTKELITGTVQTLSSTGISFIANDPELISLMLEDEELSECSLRVGEHILSPICRVIRKSPELCLEFIFLSAGEQELLDGYLESLPLEAAKRKPAPIPHNDS